MNISFRNPFLWAIAVLAVIAIPVHIFDKQIFQLLNGFHSPLMDIFWLSFTTLGDGLLICMILGCFLTINPRITVLGLAVFLLSSLVVNLVKYVVPEPRPLEVMEIVHVTGPLLRWGSFPSGHTTAGFSASFVLMGYARGFAAKGLVLFVAVLIGLSRIFVGAHFPSDVLWGCIFALLTYWFVLLALGPRIDAFMPDRPAFGFWAYKYLFYLQFGVSLFGLFVYSYKFSEYAPAAIALSVGVIVFMFLKLWEIVPISKDR